MKPFTLVNDNIRNFRLVNQQQRKKPDIQRDKVKVEPEIMSKKVNRLTFTTDISPQPSSSLFRLPAEIRSQIYEEALTPTPDPSNPYPTATCYTRPELPGPRTAAVALLRTCKAIYAETWHLPFLTSELIFYLTDDSRRPPRAETFVGVQQILNKLAETDADTRVRKVRFFAQLCNLEPGAQLQRILNMRFFQPLEITVTVRHTDFWWWESDESLRVGGDWVAKCRFPDSVRVINVEFESLERKKVQVDEICEQAVKWWEFIREDGTVLATRGEGEVVRWTGASTWGNQRWLRDETGPGTLEYYLKRITWRIKKDQYGTVIKSELVPKASRWCPKAIGVNLAATKVLPLQSSVCSASLTQLQSVGVDQDTPTAEAIEMLVNRRNEYSRNRGFLMEPPSWLVESDEDDEEDEGEDYDEEDDEEDDEDDDDDDDDDEDDDEEGEEAGDELEQGEDDEIQLNSGPEIPYTDAQIAELERAHISIA
ncbi:hypothetical protein TWF694_002077 [Orbilia ellipsospora]|uniref:Uncharacterized protein n=1 Tax=Orbilia ellipsospora TaxID=2528407 RepID=A0AAV9X4I4_9PEZI